MKNKFIHFSLLALMAASLSFSGCSKSDDSSEDTNTPTTPNNPNTPQAIVVPESNRALVIDVTGTWCPPCGAYGIPGFNQSIRLAKARMLPMAIHSTDPLSYSTMNVIANLPRYKSGSVPRIAVGNALTFPAGVYSDTMATANKIVADVDAFVNGPVTAGVVLSNLKATSSLSVDVSSKFFAAADGEYYIAVYFYENGVVSSQKRSGMTDNANQRHDHVIRGATSVSAWGEVLSSGTADTGKTTKKTYTYTLSPDWKAENMGAMAIIWKKTGTNDWEYVNGNLIEKK